MFLRKLFYALTCTAVLFTACDDNEPGFPDDGPVQDDNNIEAIVVNEGAGKVYGSLSLVYKDGTVNTDIFQQVNGRPLGSVVQSITKIGDAYFLAINGSNKVEVVDAKTFKSRGTIVGTQHGIPQQIVAISETEALVSDLSNQLMKISTVPPYGDGKVLEYIPTEGSSLGYMVVTEGKLFLMSNSGKPGLYVYDLNNLATPKNYLPEVKSLTEKTKINLDKDGILWVLTQSGNSYIYKGVDTKTEKVVKTVELPIATNSDTVKKGDILNGGSWFYARTDMTDNIIYFTLRTATRDGNLTSFNISVFKLNPETAEVEPYLTLQDAKEMYGMGVSANHEPFLGDCLDFSAQLGYVRQYKMDGTVISYKVGIYPTEVFFPDKVTE